MNSSTQPAPHQTPKELFLEVHLQGSRQEELHYFCGPSLLFGKVLSVSNLLQFQTLPPHENKKATNGSTVFTAGQPTAAGCEQGPRSPERCEASAHKANARRVTSLPERAAFNHVASALVPNASPPQQHAESPQATAPKHGSPRGARVFPLFVLDQPPLLPKIRVNAKP